MKAGRTIRRRNGARPLQGLTPFFFAVRGEEYRYLTAPVLCICQDSAGESRLRDRLHSNCGVEYRHIMFPIDSLGSFSGFGQTNDAWIEGALDLGQQAVKTALDRASLNPGRGALAPTACSAMVPAFCSELVLLEW